MDDISDMQRERGRSTYSEVLQCKAQTIEKRKISYSDESYSEEEEEKNRKLTSCIKRKKDKELREKRVECRKEYRNILNVRTDEILRERRDVVTKQKSKKKS